MSKSPDRLNDIGTWFGPESPEKFIKSFRAEKRPFTFGREKCGDCEKTAISYCENCEVGLCEDHVDSQQYSDVDVCKSETACEKRLEKHAEKNPA